MPVQVCFEIADGHALGVRQALLNQRYTAEEQAAMTNAEKTEGARQSVVALVRQIYVQWRVAQETGNDGSVT